MSNYNWKFFVLTIVMILICSVLFCSGIFDISNSLYLLHDASAQGIFGPIGPYMLPGYDLQPPLFGAAGLNVWTNSYLSPIGSNNYNVSNIFPQPSYAYTTTPSELYQRPNVGWSYPFSPMAFAPSYPSMFNVNSLLPVSVFQTSTPWTMSSQLFNPGMTSYQMTTPLALTTQSNYNPTSWSFHPTYISTPPEDSSEDEDICYLYGVGGKPAIYLYPEEDTNVTVYLDLNGALTKSDPDYQGGWNVFVTKDSTIYDENGFEYDYLFWEGMFEYDLLLLSSTGWVIAQENLGAWFDVYLNALGLIEREIAEFKEYWVARLQDSPYYEIKLLDPEVFNNLAKLTITTSDGSCPDTIIRIMFHFRRLDEYEYIEAPFIVTPERNGFVVVEWGGIYDYKIANL